MTVPTCPLGQWNGLTVSALGLGYIGMSDFCGATPDDDTGSIATIHRVIELDVSFAGHLRHDHADPRRRAGHRTYGPGSGVMNAHFTTTFGADSTAAEVIAGIDLRGSRAIVTGASSGIGVPTAAALAGAGAEVTLAVRDTAAGERAAGRIIAATGNDTVRVGRLDLADLSSVC